MFAGYIICLLSLHTVLYQPAIVNGIQAWECDPTKTVNIKKNLYELHTKVYAQRRKRYKDIRSTFRIRSVRFCEEDLLL